MAQVATILDVITIILLIILIIRPQRKSPTEFRGWSQIGGWPPTPDQNYRGPGSVPKPVQGKAR